MPSNVKNSAAIHSYQQLQQISSYNSTEQMSLGMRLDNAYFVYKKCCDLAKEENMPNKSEIDSLKNNALNFLKVTLDEESISNIEKKMSERAQKMLYNPEYIPGKKVNLTNLPRPEDAKSKAQYNLRKLSDLGLASERKQILSVDPMTMAEDLEDDLKMYSTEARDTYRVIIHNHNFVTRTSNSTGTTFLPFDTKDMTSHTKKGFGAVVINTNGEISVFQHFGKTDGVAHSSLNAGASVLFAGEIQIENGKLVTLTDHSGHYQPRLGNIYNALKFMVNQGIDISNVKVRLMAEVNEDLDLSLVKTEALKGTSRFVYNATDILALNYQQIVEIDKKTFDFAEDSSLDGPASSKVTPSSQVASSDEIKPPKAANKSAFFSSSSPSSSPPQRITSNDIPMWDSEDEPSTPKKR